MKKLMLLVTISAFFFVAAASMGQAASSSQSSDQTSAKSSTTKAPLRTIAGKISDDGKTFTADKDGKQWTLQNPDDVKGHEGHHVKLQAHVYKDKSELHVMKVTMLGTKAGKTGKKSKGSSSPS